MRQLHRKVCLFIVNDMVINMQSFSYQVKSEIIDSLNSFDKANAAVLGMLKFSKSFDKDNITLVTENEKAANFLSNQLNKICGHEAVSIKNLRKSEKSNLFTICVDDENDRVFILDFFKVKDKRLLQGDLPKKRFIPNLISGIFLACGSVIDPNKEYHIEFVIPSLELCNDFGMILIDYFDILAKHTERKNTNIVYIKESENIEDLLTLMGASKATLEMMNVKILKDVRNKINRAVNCDNANIEKSLRAAERQIEDIELIERTIGFSSLSDDLREIAEIRYNNPDYNLKELGQALNPPISRSGANHRLVRIRKAADEIRQGKAKKT